MPEQRPTAEWPPLVVGVGATAGGVDALRELLSGLGAAPGLTLLFIQHRDPAAAAPSIERLGAATAMDVVPINTRRKLKTNIVYVSPPGAWLAFNDGWVRVSSKQDGHHPGVIDHCFYSIAAQLRERGVGVILSGEGSDGTLGLKAISDQGGLTFAQTETSARHDALPRSAVTTGIADHMLAPRDIATELLKYRQHLAVLAAETTPPRLQKSIADAIPLIAERLLQVTGHNFQHYKVNTLVRRIRRRMQVSKFGRVNDYLDYLNRHDAEAQALFRELLVSVTAFFRDPDAFAALQNNVLHTLLAERSPDDGVRIWVAGCADGSEAYSVAMLCREAMDAVQDPCQVQIFATDIDQRALQVARAGAYPSGIAKQVPPQRLRRFFIKRGKHYHVTEEIRELVAFSTHNLIADPPFSRQDLIVCRNLLIYLGPHLQNKLIPLFHASLRPGGHLFLGPSESITAHAELFRPVEAGQGIAQRQATAIANAPSLSAHDSQLSTDGGDASQGDQRMTDLTAVAQRIVLDEFAPKYVIVNDSGKIRNAAPEIEKYVRLGSGDYRNNIIKMAASGLRTGLRAALAEAKKTRRRVDRENLSVTVGDKIQRIVLTVQPMPRLGKDQPLHMVVFQDIGQPVEREQLNTPTAQAGGHADPVIARLELELEAARQDLDKTLQDVESAREEMKSSNEELLSINEELRAANEELHTSREEIHAANEALARANADLQNLLHGSQIAAVFLDNRRRIRSFTPAISDIYQLIATDVGRPLENFVPAVHDMPPLPERRVLAKVGLLEDTIQARSGKSYIRRVLPYYGAGGETDGMVLTFTDVSELKESEAMLKRSLLAANMDAFRVDLRTTKAKRFGPLRDTLQLTDNANDFFANIHADDRAPFEAAYQSCTHGDPDYEITYRYRRPDGRYEWLTERAEVTFDESGEAVGVAGTYQVVTQQKLAELDLADREAHLRRVLDNTLNLVGVLDPQGRLLEANQTALDLGGITREDVLGKPFWECYWWAYDSGVAARLEQATRTARSGEVVRYDEVVRMAGDTRMTIDFMLAPVYNDAGEVTHLIPSGVDISERRAQQEQLAAALARLELSLRASGAAVWSWDIDSNQPLVDDGMKHYFGFDADATPTLDDFIARMHEEDRDRVTAAIRDSLVEGGPYDQEYRVVRPSGAIRWLRAVGRGVVTGEGRLQDFFGVVFDSTEQKRRELALVDRETEVRRIIDNQHGFLAVLDNEGTLTEINARVLNASGLPRSHYIGKKFWEIANWQYDADAPRRIRHDVERALGGELVRYDTITLLEDKLVPIDFMLAPVKNAAGNVTHVIPSAIDISVRKAAEKALALNEQRLRMAAKAAGFGTFHVDIKKQQVVWSAEMRELLGLSEQQNIDLRLGEVPAFVHPEDRGKVGEYLQLVLTDLDTADHIIEHRVIRPDDAVRYVRMQSHSLFAGKGEGRRLRTVVGTLMDITEQQAYEVNLQHERQLAEAASASKSAFLANVSHEIRTPMAAILGHADILLSHLSDPDNRESADKIRRNGEHLLEIVNDILDLSRIEADRMEIDRARCAVAELLNDIHALMEVRAAEKDIAFSVEATTPLPVAIVTDAKRLKQILINLVGNAIKFTPQGQVVVRAGFEPAAGDGTLRFDVEDTGIGIPRTMLEDLFQPFNQGDVSRTREYGGSGLGLTISRKLAELLDGELLVASEEGKGSTFSLLLGVAAADQLTLQPYHHSGVPATAGEHQPSARLSGHYLLVDDRRDIRVIYQAILEEAGARVTTGVDGNDALRLFDRARERGQRFNAIIMDMQMPHKDGATAVAELRAQGCDTPVLALTADAMQYDKDDALQAGCDAYLAKPVGARVLVDAVARLSVQPAPDGATSDAPRCLVVDDNADAAKVTAMLLRSKGVLASEQHSGQAALEQALAESPRAVILDIGLTDITGHDVARQLRAQGYTGKLIALSGRDQPEDIKDSLDAGFDYHYVKPGDIGKIADLLKSH